MSLFRHKHRNVVVRSTHHPHKYNDDGTVNNSYYSYERDTYPFCIECGEEMVSDELTKIEHSLQVWTP